jgi:hypothetical protein
MNKQIAGSNMESKSLEEVVLESWNSGSPSPVFNNAAQVRTSSSSSSRGRVRLHVCRDCGISSWEHLHAPTMSGHIYSQRSVT